LKRILVKKKARPHVYQGWGNLQKKKEEKQSIYKEKENRALERETGVKYSEKKKRESILITKTPDQSFRNHRLQKHGENKKKTAAVQLPR
jgi:hypothetical protein